MSFIKKILILLIFTIIFYPNFSHSKDLATWGFVGSKCGQTIKVAREFGREGKDALGYSVQGFLTGYNSHVMLMNLQGKSNQKAKVINKFSIKEVTDILISKCTANQQKQHMSLLLKFGELFQMLDTKGFEFIK